MEKHKEALGRGKEIYIEPLNAKLLEKINKNLANIRYNTSIIVIFMVLPIVFGALYLIFR